MSADESMPDMTELFGRPDFPSLDAAAVSSADRRTFMLALVGNLSFAWSNNESLFVYLIRALMQTDEASSVIVFVTLNTARSRLELVERLGRAKLRDPKLRGELESLLRRFDDCTKIRNEFNHCIYGIDSDGVLSHTQAFRIRDVRGKQALEAPKPIDEARVSLLLKTIDEMKLLNRAIWEFLPRLQQHMALSDKLAAPPTAP